MLGFRVHDVPPALAENTSEQGACQYIGLEFSAWCEIAWVYRPAFPLEIIFVLLWHLLCQHAGQWNLRTVAGMFSIPEAHTLLVDHSD
jgi:hypothetical protein